MKTLKQLSRQPLKTLLGLLLMTLASAIACLCVGQALAAETMKITLDERFSTVAIPSEQKEFSLPQKICVEPELLEWLEKMAQEHPDIVKGAAPNGILSAYIPQLLPFNREAVANVSRFEAGATLVSAGYEDYTATTHYDSAMFVITLEQVGEPMSPMENYQFLQDAFPTKGHSVPSYIDYVIHDFLPMEQRQSAIEGYLRRTDTDGYTVQLTGTIDRVLSLPEGMRDPLGMTARLNLTLPSMQDIEALELTPGRQYIVYGMDYYDDYQFLVEYMKQSRYKHVSFSPLDPSLLELPTQEEAERFKENWDIDVVMLYDRAPLEQWQLDRLNAVSMTLCQPSNLIAYEQVRNEAGELVELVPQTKVTYQDAAGSSITMDMETFNSRYAVPTIAPLEGSVEDFLASAEGAAWQAALNRDAVNNHAFAVVGVEDLHHLAAFTQADAQIETGREFTADEVRSGAKVCIIHEWVANNSGLQIGDTVTLGFYQTDHALPYQTTRAQDAGLLRPAATLYFDTTPILETGEYTIVGIWQGDIWPVAAAMPYCFSANTVFVPTTSVQTAMEQCESIAFVSAVLENGRSKDFQELAKNAGYGGRFKYYDQDYSVIAGNFHNYEDLARQVLTVGAVIYVILLLLFLLLYPGTQKNAVRTMATLGARCGKRFAHVLGYAMAIVVPASVLGGAVGILLWEHLVEALQATAESVIALQIEQVVLVQLAAVQLLLALVLNICVAIFVAAPRGMSARR